MKTLSDYTIYCTKEQTKRALELGVPLKHLGWQDCTGWDDDDCTPNNSVIVGQEYIQIPTAEQMIGWLEDKGITVEMVKCETHWFARTYSHENTNFNKGRFFSRKEATLAAINTALDYLNKTNK